MYKLPSNLSYVYISERQSLPAIDNVHARGVLWQASKSCLLFEIPNIAQYLISHGQSIEISPKTGADKFAIEQYLRMTPLAALVYQSGGVALHASCATNGKKTILLVGDSGVGKSTILYQLLKQGWLILSDELTIINSTNDEIVVYPTYDEIMLSKYSIDSLCLDPTNAIGKVANKCIFKVSENYNSSPKTLNEIYWITPSSNDDYKVDKVIKSECIKSFSLFVYNSQIADALVNITSYYKCSTLIAKNLIMYKLSRPRGNWNYSKILDIIHPNDK